LLKSVIPLTAVLVMMQAAAVLLRSIAVLRQRGAPATDETS
jgi:hypothetical protein